jgi:glycosyltransferase involved in cell wall biosynthesis
MFTNPFELKKQDHLIPADCDVVVVGDLFAEDYLGGAELTTRALIDSSPGMLKIHKMHSKNITMKTLESGYNKFWIFTNFSQMDMELIPTIVSNVRYAIIEYDYKFCRYRSIEKHLSAEMEQCGCHNEMHGKLISAFFHGATTCFYMSEAQMKRHHERFPFLAEEEGSSQYVLSSVFSEEFFAAIKLLREKYKDSERKGWLALGSPSWIKGTSAAVTWCEDNNKEYELLQGLSHVQVLEKMAQAEGFVYLPLGGDTCPRMVLEAQLLGCKLEVNDNVQHMTEIPFNGTDLLDIESYLYASRDLFWNMIQNDMDWQPNISGYITTKDCISQKYPFENCIESLSSFCSEIVVMDGGSTDGTLEKLHAMAETNDRLKVYVHEVDWEAKRFAVQDGLQKARAREKCTGEFCWQMDSDEEVNQKSVGGIIKLCRQFPKFVDLVSLPVIEYWGSTEKVRIDVNPWKWRLSRNKPHITHGIPRELRLNDEAGNLYSAPGTDGCDYIHSETFERLPHASFYTNEIHSLRIRAMQGDKEALETYESWFNRLVDTMPSIKHYSWMDIERKIKTYKTYWQRHWESLYDIKQEDTADNNMFFDKPWSDVSAKEINQMATDLAEKTGGHVFHSKVDWEKPMPHIRIEE